jgi:fibronectin type 3 domain-containing protein
MKPASITILLCLAALPVLAAPGAFTLSGSAFCYSHDAHQPGIRLTWPPSAGATGYDVYKNGVRQEPTLPFSPSTYTFEQTDNSMASGQTISYYVIARDNSGGSFTSNTVDVFIPGDVCQAAPAPPVLDGSAACDPTGPRAIVNLTWSAPPTATSYVITRTPSSPAFPVTTPATAYTDTTVNPGSTYTYKVTATNSGGSTDSNTKSISVSESICPPGPLTATATAFCGAGPPVAPAVRVDWTASAFAASYVVKRDGTPVSGTLSSSTTTFNDFSGVTVGQTYNYTVTATNASGNATSPPASVSITGLGCTPPPPGSFAASVNQLCNLGAPAAHVTWNASSGASSYVVNRNGSPISSSLSSSTTSYDDINVTPGQTYTYTVTATSGGGSTTSASASLTIASCGNGNGNAPSPFTAAVSAFCNSGSPAVHVTWSAGSGATSYVVNRNGTQISGTLSSVTLMYDDTTVTAGQSYTYAVVGSNAGGSTAAPAGSITPSANVCPPPAFTLTASATCNPIVSPPLAMVTLNWSAAATATSYLIIRNGTQIGSVDGSTTTFNDGGASSPQTYSYVVRAVGPGGTSDSNTASATVQPNMCSTPKPDLAATDITFALATGHAGDTFGVSITVTNLSTSAAAPATTSRIRIGSGLTMSPFDPILAAIGTPALAAGASSTPTTTVTIPNLPAGTYFLFLSVDEDHISGDINPSNDIKRSTAFTIQAAACTLGCATTVAATAQAATPVVFALQQQPACPNVSAVWTFGDTASTTGFAPTHTYATAGIYHWTLTLTVATGETCSSSGNITITAPAAAPKRRAVRH